jgi:hypothetical protein
MVAARMWIARPCRNIQDLRDGLRPAARRDVLSQDTAVFSDRTRKRPERASAGDGFT